MLGLTETWIEKKGWKKIKDKLPNKFIWNYTAARRVSKKGRAKGGIVTAVNKNIKEVSVRELSFKATEIKLKYNGSR